jgi:hypothetical protein
MDLRRRVQPRKSRMDGPNASKEIVDLPSAEAHDGQERAVLRAADSSGGADPDGGQFLKAIRQQVSRRARTKPIVPIADQLALPAVPGGDGTAPNRLRQVGGPKPRDRTDASSARANSRRKPPGQAVAKRTRPPGRRAA